MPSGAKKRKAAKKKKESQSNNHSNPFSASAHPYGDEDLKHQEDKDSDAGEVSSPASQDHHSHQNLLTEGEEVEIEKERKLSNLPSVEGLKTDNDEKHIVVEESVVEIEREFKIEDESDKKDGKIEHDEAARKSYDGGPSGSSSSSGGSSDDESRVIKNSQASGGIASVVDSIKVADSLPGKSAEAIHGAPAQVGGDSIVENIPPSDSEKISVLGKQVELDVSSPADFSVAPYAVESVFKENGEKKQVSIEDKVGTSVASMDAGVEREVEAIAESVENTAIISNRKECVTQENDDRLTLPYNAPTASADNAAEHAGVAEPLLVPSHGPVQKTSWRSCCGLFEVFSQAGT